MALSFLKKLKVYSPISIGMRTFKTWLAVTLTATLSLTSIIGNPFYAVMGTVFGMQNTVSHSFEIARCRIIGTAVGAFIGFVFAYFELTSPPLIALAIVMVIIACGLLKIEEAIFITFTLCLLIMLNPDRDEGLFLYTALRVVDTAIGLVIGVVINYYIVPPNYLKSLTLKLDSFYALTEKVADDRSLFPKLKKELADLEFLHSNFQADAKYDGHDLCAETIERAVEACSYLYVHLRHSTPDASVAQEYHRILAEDALIYLKNTIDQLKGVL